MTIFQWFRDKLHLDSIRWMTVATVHGVWSLDYFVLGLCTVRLSLRSNASWGLFLHGSLTLVLYLHQNSICSCKSSLLIFRLLVRMVNYYMHVQLLLMMFLLVKFTLLYGYPSSFLDGFCRTSYFVQRILQETKLVTGNTMEFFPYILV